VNTTSTTLGRFSKSTGRLLADDNNSNVSDRAQTLPRKLRTESKIKKQVNKAMLKSFVQLNYAIRYYCRYLFNFNFFFGNQCITLLRVKNDVAKINCWKSLVFMVYEVHDFRCTTHTHNAKSIYRYC